MNGPNHRLTLQQMRERSWRTTRELQNGNMVIPVGTVAEVIQKRGGVTIVAQACEHCGVRPIISRVDIDRDLEPITPKWNP